MLGAALAAPVYYPTNRSRRRIVDRCSKTAVARGVTGRTGSCKTLLSGVFQLAIVRPVPGKQEFANSTEKDEDAEVEKRGDHDYKDRRGPLVSKADVVRVIAQERLGAQKQDNPVRNVETEDYEPTERPQTPRFDVAIGDEIDPQDFGDDQRDTYR